MLNLSDGSAAAPALDMVSALGSSFSAVNENQRAGLALIGQGNTPGGPLVFAVWGSHCDASVSGQTPYTGWVAAFHYFPGALQFVASFNDEGSGGTQGGIWMSGAAPAITLEPESQTLADLYLATGNGSWNGTSQFGESVLQLHHSTGSFALTGFYTPNAWSILNNGSGTNCTSPLHLPPPYAPGATACSPGDFDLDSGGVILARPAGTGFLPTGDTFEVLAGGKEGAFYVLDPSKMNNSAADTIDPCSTGSSGQTIQCFGAIQLPLPCCTGTRDYGSRGSNAFWAGNSTFTENVLYVAGSQDSEVRAYQMTTNGGGVFTTSTLFGYEPTPDGDTMGLARYPGSSPVISWNTSDTVNGANNAILWILATSGNGTVPVKLYAYQAVPPLPGQQFSLKWHDTTNGPLPTKFMVPTVINGYVYVGGQKPGASRSAGSCLGRVVAWH